jgi:hypothetical protein
VERELSRPEGELRRVESTKFASDSMKFAFESTKFASKSTQFAVDSTQLASDSTQLASDSTQLALDSTQLASDSTQLASDSTQLTSDSTQLALDSTQHALDSARVAFGARPSDHSNALRRFRPHKHPLSNDGMIRGATRGVAAVPWLRRLPSSAQGSREKMKTTKNTTPHSSFSSTSSNVAAPKRTRARKPPVADRVAITGPVALPVRPSRAAAAGNDTATAPASSASPSPTPAPGPVPAPAPSGGSSAGSSTDQPVSPPPPVTLPPIPNGFVPVNAADLRGYRPMASEIAALPDAIVELQGFSDYLTLFGITAPPLDELVQRLSIAGQWTSVLSQTLGWSKYVKSQEGMAWKDALEFTEKLKAPFQLATAANPALLSQYPALARLLGASKAAALRGTRRPLRVPPRMPRRRRSLQRRPSRTGRTECPLRPPRRRGSSRCRGEVSPRGGRA